MTFTAIQQMFNRAFLLSLSFKKWLLSFVVLALCGVLVVFCRGLAVHAGYWVALSLTFLPLFLSAGVFLSLGIVLIRYYHDEVKKKEAHFKWVLQKSWDLLIGSVYFSVPLILCYILLWMLLGVFLLLQQIPGIGPFFGVILSFAPFLINLAILFLCVATFVLLFFLTPVVALKGLNRNVVFNQLAQHLQGDPFSNLILFMIALIPLVLVLLLVTTAAYLTGTICSECNDALSVVLQWFFVMLPFTALLTPSVIFFFNFAAESYVWQRKRGEEAP